MHLKNQKNVGFSGSARATELHVPESMVMFALNLFKASVFHIRNNKGG